MKKKPNKYVCNSIEELRDAFDSITSVIAGDTRFMAQALLFIAEQSVKPVAKRKPSAWQKFLGTEMKAGRTVQQAAHNWQARKRNATKA